MTEIRWLGHACFQIRGRDARILMDPVGPETGYDIGRQSADIVTVSHDHPGHHALDVVEPGYRVITGPGEYEIKEVFINGISTFHDAERGKHRGKNTVYLIEVDDLMICHLGDLGHALTEEQAERVSSVDVLIIPVGGGTTIDAATAVEVVGQIEPSIVIPMQYRNDRGDHDRDTADRFLKEIGAADIQPQDRLTLKKSDLAETMQIILLQ